jgi:phospholipid transport system substrate-binding protein
MSARRVAALVAAASLLAVPALAQEAPIQQLDAALIASMKLGKSAGFAARAKELAPAVDAAFDLPGILREVVGPTWSSIPAAQQQQLMTAFRNFTIASYAANFNGFSGQTIKIVPPIRVVGQDKIVPTTINSDGSTNQIDYQMREVDGAWKAEDVLLGGTISNVAVQRSDFRRMLDSGGAAKLIESLNSRSAALAQGSDG